jgi:hypothetical protein
MSNFMGQGLSEKPMVPVTLHRELGQRVADVDPAAVDTQSEDVSPREIGKKNSVLGQCAVVFGHLDNVRRLGSNESFNWFIGDDGNIAADGTG